MKIILEQIQSGEEELILRYRQMTDKLNEMVQTLTNLENRNDEMLYGMKELGQKELFLFSPGEVIYFESVEGAVFAYTREEVYRVNYGLQELSKRLEKNGFFRCSKSLVVDVYQIEYLKSQQGNRILATMSNGEKIMISRRYAKELRQLLKGR